MSWRSIIGLAALALSSAARADDLSPEKLAAVERDLQAALARVDARHAGQDAGESLMGDYEAARELIRERQDAEKEVLDRHGVDGKALARRRSKLSRDERAEVDAEKARLAEESQRPREAEPSGQEVEIQRGIDEKRPVDVFREPGQVPVETLCGGEGAEEGEACKDAEKKEPPPKAKAKPPKHKRKRR